MRGSTTRTFPQAASSTEEGWRPQSEDASLSLDVVSRALRSFFGRVSDPDTLPEFRKLQVRREVRWVGGWVCIGGKREREERKEDREERHEAGTGLPGSIAWRDTLHARR